MKNSNLDSLPAIPRGGVRFIHSTAALPSPYPQRAALPVAIFYSSNDSRNFLGQTTAKLVSGGSIIFLVKSTAKSLPLSRGHQITT